MDVKKKKERTKKVTNLTLMHKETNSDFLTENLPLFKNAIEINLSFDVCLDKSATIVTT